VYTRGRCDFVFQERYSINKLDDEDAYTGVEVEAPVKVGWNMLTKTYNVKTLLPLLLSMTVKTVKHLIMPNTGRKYCQNSNRVKLRLNL
jgi:hypothetical protein